jgi:dihydrofolate reductase
MAVPLLSLVAAAGSHNELGKDGAMPWHLPADLRHFKSLTLGKPVLMGRKTLVAIGRPLPERRNIVVSRDPEFRAAGCETAASLEAALALAGAAPEVMVIGGGEIYRVAWARARRIHLTRVHGVFDADTFFPEIDPAEWRETAREDHLSDAKNPFAYSFVTLERS